MKRGALLPSLLVLLAGSVALSRGITLHGPTVSELCMRADAIFIGTAGESSVVFSLNDWTVSRTPIRVETWIRGEPHGAAQLYHHTRGDGLRGPSFRFTRRIKSGERVLVFAEHKRFLQQRESTFQYAADFAPEPKYAVLYRVNGRGSGFVFTILEDERIRETWHYHKHPKTLDEALAQMKYWLDRPEPHQGIQARLIYYDKKRYAPGSMFLSLRNVGDEVVTLDNYAYPDDAMLEALDQSGKVIKSIEAFGYRRKWKERDPPSIGDILELEPGESMTSIISREKKLDLPPGEYRLRIRVTRVHREPHLPGTVFTGEFYSNLIPITIE